MEQNLTTGSVKKALLRFSLPFLLSFFLQTLYGMADLFIIGQFGSVADTTAVSIGSQVTHMITVMLVGLAMGSTVLIGQAIGANQKTRAARIIGNTITLFVLLSIALVFVLVLLVDPMVKVMSTPTEAVAGCTDYLTICFIGIPCITAYNVISAILRGMGDSKRPMYFIAIACVANIVLDYVFIGALHLGSAGAAYGTVTAQAISVLISLCYLLKRKLGIPFTLRECRPDRGAILGVLRVGVPIALQDGFIQISFLVIAIFANLRGLNDAAAVGIVEKIVCMLFLVPSSMLQSVSAISAQNVGAKKYDRARQTLGFGILISVSWGLLAIVTMQFFAGFFVGLFTDSAEVVRLGSQYLHGYVVDCAVAGIHFCFSGYFCAYGYSGMSFMHNALSILCARIPLSYLASVYFVSTLLPMGLAPMVGSVLSNLICIGVYLYLRKKQKVA